ncbi:Cilia- and flagella-associated protein 44 [Amphibalanus amphitrite]|uniref:Cilia- and flagella-associated protein 44 n=1 Tax=Amphibalanus amphitrite TaxID=1232801 RepID=A0A6A4WAK4_AMPAM|nr:Cilia- and flagella-associated protein 44 [Amphibalanus amphitrite]
MSEEPDGPLQEENPEPVPTTEAEPTADATEEETDEAVAAPQEQPQLAEDQPGSQVTGSGSRTSRRSRTSMLSAPQEEPWVPPEYRPHDFVSGPEVSEHCPLGSQTLQFVSHSFGYDCLKADNLCLLDVKTAMFVSGNLVHFLDLEDRSLSYMRSSAPGGIGHATVHPGGQHFAVAEKGDGPRIIVYRWPERTVYRVLTGGTQREYAYVAFNASGDLLASQGGDPDFMLTVWNWETESTLLRCKAFSQDVYKVTFSPFHPGQLTSAGLGHIKLWKMAKTFTGLKLQGRLGRFGKTEISDINGFLQLPDGKVISGCEWGNILVWDDALIKVEITRRDGKPCHNGTIHKFHLEEGELISLGSDGWVRTWDFDTVDQAEASEELNGRYALDPMNELQFAAGSNLVSMWPHPDPDLESIWFMQDGNGGIWKADLSFSMTTRGPERLYECPAGPLRALVACPTGPLMAATGDDGHIAVFNYRRRELLVRSRFPAGGTTLIWLSAEVCGKTSQLLAGFADGCLRLVELHAAARKGAFGLSLVYVQKPHTAPITVMKQSPSVSWRSSASHMLLR